jgi:hypothetical protein
VSRAWLVVAVVDPRTSAAATATPANNFAATFVFFIFALFVFVVQGVHLPPDVSSFDHLRDRANEMPPQFFALHLSAKPGFR